MRQPLRAASVQTVALLGAEGPLLIRRSSVMDEGEWTGTLCDHSSHKDRFLSRASIFPVFLGNSWWLEQCLTFLADSRACCESGILLKKEIDLQSHWAAVIDLLDTFSSEWGWDCAEKLTKAVCDARALRPQLQIQGIKVGDYLAVRHGNQSFPCS
jgi:hypothetical protein